MQIKWVNKNLSNKSKILRIKSKNKYCSNFLYSNLIDTQVI